MLLRTHERHSVAVVRRAVRGMSRKCAESSRRAIPHHKFDPAAALQPDGHRPKKARRGMGRVWVVGAFAGVGLVTLVAFGSFRSAPKDERSVSGQLVSYEATSRTLTLATEAGEQRFVVSDDAAVHEGARDVSLVTLASARGCRAKVWYRHAAQSTANDVRIACGGPPPDDGNPSRP